MVEPLFTFLALVIFLTVLGLSVGGLLILIVCGCSPDVTDALARWASGRDGRRK